jgi:hypothetical protein
MKKNLPLFSLLLIPILAACQPNQDQRVVIPFADEVNTMDGQYRTLATYNDLQVMVEQDNTFILMVGNATCGCTVEFLPVMRQWIEQTKIVTYYLEYTLLQGQSDTFGVPVVTGSVPVLAIFDQGNLASYKAYNPNKAKDNEVFYSLSLLTEWFENRIILPSFQFLTKANFDELFTRQQKMIIYIGRNTCPDCTYAFNTFMVPFIRANPSLPPIYGLDVLDNQIWQADTGNSTPGWAEFKTNYGMDNVLNTTFGYATGFVPTFMYIETNGQSIQANPLIIKDMIVTYNDSSLLNPSLPFNADTNPRTTQLSRTFFDGSRPLQYTNLNLTTVVLPAHSSSAELRSILEPYHNQAMADFFAMYLPLVNQ